MNLILVAIIVPILAFIFEVYPRLLNRKFGVDIWTHLLYLKEFYRQKKLPRNISNGFLIPGDYDYPPLFILILSRFPFKLVEKYEFLFSPFFDSLLIFSTFFVSFYLTNNLYFSLLTQIIYTLTPIIILENSSATPRSLGYGLFTTLFISLFLYAQNGQVLLIIISILCGTLIFLTHRFTAQGFLFFSLFFTLIEKNYIYVSVFLISFLFAIIFSKGFYLKVLRGHIGNLIFWFNNAKYRFSHQVKGNTKSFKSKDFLFRTYNQFLKFPPFVLAITNPWTLPPLYMFFFYGMTNPLIDRFALLVVFSYILSIVITWVPILRFLGEGQRYLELTAYPSAFLSATLLYKNFGAESGRFLFFGYLIVGFASLVTIIVIQRKGIIRDRFRTTTPEMLRMFSYLRSIKAKPKLLCIPHQMTTNTIYHTGCQVFVNASYKDMQKISDVYPVIKKSIREIMKINQLDMILLNENYSNAKDLKLGRYSVMRREENFVLLKP